MDVLESDVGPINKAKLHLALTVAAFLVEDEVRLNDSTLHLLLACAA